MSCITQNKKQTIKDSSSERVPGKYQKVNGSEILFLNEDKTIVCLRNYHAQKSDVIVPLCDTMAKGVWNQREGFIVLKNEDDFNKIEYSIIESEITSKDSIYFKVILPNEDALKYENYKFSIIPSSLVGQFIESNKPEFAISRKLWDDITFGFVIQNIAQNCAYGRKSYQRIYFNVFTDYRPKNNRSNFFTITLSNFNQCFYEAMDIDGDVIGIGSNGLFWGGSYYRKIN